MIISRLSGGMGNQMFQYALGRALSLKYHTLLGLDTTFLLDRTPRKKFTFRDYDLDVFTIDADILPKSKIPFFYRPYLAGKPKLYFDILRRRLLPNKGREKFFQFDPTILNTGPEVYLVGYWQSPKYFAAIEDVIRKDFTVKEPFEKKVQELMSEIESMNALCVHVRRGDYVNNPHYVSIGVDYYNAAIEKIKHVTDIGKVYVFSDDISWCQENMNFSLPVIFVGEEYAGKKGEGHLVLMRACKHFIIPNSTFSWWAAWLAENPQKIVIVPKQWFSDSTIDTTDLIPESWMRL